MSLRIAALALVVCTLLAARTRPAVISGETSIDGHLVHYVIARLDAVRVRPALGGATVGETAWLAEIATTHRAMAGINGGYFEAYRPGRRKNLIHTLMIDGTLMFKGDVGSVLWFDRDQHATIARVPLRIDGSLDGSDVYPNNWYAYWLNRLPGPGGETITIFTPAWGARTGLHGGPQVQVTNGAVTAIADGSMRIPRNGYVVYFRGEARVASHFAIGRRASYTVTQADGSPLGDLSHAYEILGGGPQLLAAGFNVVDPGKEGFSDPKVFGAGRRSIVGISRDGSELILAVTEGTLNGCALIMRRLGAWNAMNLDGGASSALWASGRYLVPPGRRINNALLIVPADRR
jgi:hypothetical protein